MPPLPRHYAEIPLANGSRWFLMFTDDNMREYARAAVAAERERCCSIVYGQCGSDNVAQRTVDAIRAALGKKDAT
jgi:hypothetical protein